MPKTSTAEFSEAELNRLRWRSRRGMLELDLLLVPYFETRFAGLNLREQQTFIKLLAQDDVDLLQWFNRTKTPTDPALAALVSDILREQSP